MPKDIPALDALRGVAVTLVIASHALPMAQNLPWAIKRFSNLGFFGVQLFFVVSAITLAQSWRGRPGSLRAFALRRVFRIAPAYFFAAALYALLLPGGQAGVLRILTFLTFTSGWSPAQMPTVPDAWVGVPGGWSIEAEAAFYALFPLLMWSLRGPARVAAGFALSLLLAWAADLSGAWFFGPVYGPAATDQFLYYWLPNQLPVFLVGLAAYEALEGFSPGRRWQVFGARLARVGPLLCGLSVCAFLMLAFLPWPRLPRWDHVLISVHVLAAVAFAVAAVALVLRPWVVVVNRFVVAVGRASFSAYLVHFAIIDVLGRVLPASVFRQTGLAAAFAGCGLFLVVFGLTVVAAQVSYRLIELPGIRLGGRVIAWTRSGTVPVG
jgi:peptidoglycan/LPS O-acetylase OafA/YrhL